MTDPERDNYVYPGNRYTRCGMVSGHGQGMSLRDALAMNAPVTWADVHDAGGWVNGVALSNRDERAAVFAVMAVLRYEYADAMLEERKAEG